MDHEHLVARVAGTGKGQSGRNHIRALRFHASAVIDDQADRDRNILVAKMPDRLQHSVFVDLEIVLVESGNKKLFVFLGGCAQDYHVYIYLERVWVGRGGARGRGLLRPSDALGGDQDEKGNQIQQRRGSPAGFATYTV